MESEHQRHLAVIMFTDIVGYSALAQKNEALSLELLEEHRELLRPIFGRFGGREIETIGDAFFLEFTSALGLVSGRRWTPAGARSRTSCSAATT